MGNLSHKWLVVLSVLFGTFAVILNNSMLNPVLPELEDVFNTDAVGVSWILTMFMIMMGMTMPVTGYLGDRWGKKKVYIIGLALFATGSLIGAVSQWLSIVIIARAIQGIAGGLMMPNAMALIFQAFPKNQRGFAVGIYGVSVMIAPAIGPTIGGMIAENFDWYFLFLINLPFAFISMFFSIKFLKSTEPDPTRVFDWKGFVLITSGVGMVLYVLGQARDFEHALTGFNLTLLVLGALLIYMFIKYELKQKAPLLDLSIFKVKTYRYSIVATSAASIGLFSNLFLLPYLIQDGYGLSMVKTGLLFIPSALASGAFMTIGGRILDKKGPKLVVPTGLIVLTFACLMFGLVDLETSFWVLLIINIIHGMGLGFGNMPATTTGMNAIPDHLVAQGSAMNNLIRQTASSLGIVFFSVYFEIRRGMYQVSGLTTNEATLEAINEAFIVAAVIIAISVPFAYKMKGYQNDDKKE
ncbi:MDR family MFS transporter [Tenuibacillus multivorans]|uniref:Drug resistance transporter, EmrB/QacA subfamily n=1 Tax=Tenuibacillus multivorans TaxID=237069 RepID=A0A1H0E475_9BACI|nr:MDR family MFS transporter [Tenuibacillus multivorans]GEL76658.1 MFS transporter [Tenuibacillus multivorans]SDN77212.1 drug resistance transporter, EmrB/QacA subfamily [Tenuibacillus multivorans]